MLSLCWEAEPQSSIWKIPVTSKNVNSMLVHKNMLIVSEGVNLHTYDIRLKERTSQITTTKKCISLFMDERDYTLYAGCSSSVLIFKVGLDRVTFVGQC